MKFRLILDSKGATVRLIAEDQDEEHMLNLLATRKGHGTRKAQDSRFTTQRVEILDICFQHNDNEPEDGGCV